MSTSRAVAAGWAFCAALSSVPAAAAGDTRQIVDSVCAACHGDTGNSPVPLFPRLAGLRAEYIAKQLDDYMAGRRKSDVMAPAIAQLTPADVPGLAAYYAAQAPQPGTAGDDAALARTGQQLFESGNAAAGVPGCIGCHQAGAKGDARFPRLAGQHAAYTTEQMAQFKNGARHNDKARVMRAIAARLSERETAALSAYLAEQ